MSMVLGQGSLTPPAAPTPTMKTLVQIDTHITNAGEKRTDILTLLGDGGSQHVITAGGSYYLSDRIFGVANKTGITIEADNVTIDLNGFVLNGSVSTSTSGIFISGAHANIAVHHGTLTGWGGSGIAASTANNCALDDLRVSVNTLSGIVVGDHCNLTRCIATGNGRNGILTGDACTVIGCTAHGNGNDTSAFWGGINVGAGCTVRDCTADNNGNSTSGGAGFVLNTGSTVGGSTARANSAGISALGDRVNIIECNVTASTGNGIFLSGTNGCYVLNNNVSANNGTGIFLGNGGGGHRIEGNQVRGNTNVGIGAGTSSATVVIRNSAGNNTGGNYNFSAASDVGPIGQAATATSPWANLEP